MKVQPYIRHSFRILIGFVLTIPFFMSASCPGFQRSPCRYETNSVKAYISHYTLEQDSVIEIWFKALEEQQSWAWNADDQNKTGVWLHSNEFERCDFTIDAETADDTSILYIVDGSFIFQGTCSPTSILSVEPYTKLKSNNDTIPTRLSNP